MKQFKLVIFISVICFQCKIGYAQSVEEFRNWLGINDEFYAGLRKYDYKDLEKKLKSGDCNKTDKNGFEHGLWIFTNRYNYTKRNEPKKNIQYSWLNIKKLEYASINNFKFNDSLYKFSENHLVDTLYNYFVDFEKKTVVKKKVNKLQLKSSLLNYSANDSIVEYGLLFRGLKEGMWTQFYKNGSKQSILPYSLGYPGGSGFYQSFYKSGQIKEHGTWRKGRYVGSYMDFYENGLMKTKITFNEEGKEEGFVIRYFINGYVEEIGESINGKKQGIWANFNNTGQLVSSGKYTEGKLIESNIVEYFLAPLVEYVNLENANIDRRRDLSIALKDVELLNMKELKGKNDIKLLEKTNIVNSLILDRQQQQIQINKVESINSNKNIEILEKDKLLKIKEVKQKELEIRAQKKTMIVLVGVSLLILLLLVVVIKGFYNKKRDNKLIVQQKEIVESSRKDLEEKHKEITDSIHYAKRIQAAILPPNKIVKQHLKDSFILYKPKDIVAGDFYWLEVKDKKVLFAAADCTGHGVPGAMVSVVCNNGLNRSVREHGITDPGKILDKTRQIVIQEFEKSDDEVKDGMDISLCVLDGQKLYWAGANNPLWIIRNGNLIEVKPDKQPIGKYAEEKPFTTHEIELQQGDSIYVFTDGYQDQFGGNKSKKFKAAKLKELLLGIQHENMDIQLNSISQTFDRWRGDLEQVDDVCVIGVRV